MQIQFSIIAAMDSERGIGKNDSLPWILKGDMKHFFEITSKTVDPNKKNAVIMGRKTWESIPVNHKPLKNRLNIVLTRNKIYKVPDEVLVFSSLETALVNFENKNLNVEKIFVIGGAEIYKLAIENHLCQKLFLTEIKNSFDCNTFFPKIPDRFEKVKESDKIEENGVEYKFVEYVIS